MAAAFAASRNGNEVVLLERNEKLGKKIYITGKGRCNYTNSCDVADFFENIFENKRFAYSAVYSFDSVALNDLLEQTGFKGKTERGSRMFPVSDKASDVTKAFFSLLKNNGVEIKYNTYVSSLKIRGGIITGVEINGREHISADNVILCCGGKSYPTTGSDGNGYALARQAGHTVSRLYPALCGMMTKEKWVGELAGLGLKNVNVTLSDGSRQIKSEFGELLFTHNGISGPTVLSLSCYCRDISNLRVTIDLKPALSEKQLDMRILRDFEEEKNKDFKNSLNKLLPLSLAKKITELSGIPSDKKINQITAEERKHIAELLKGLELNIASLCGFNEAIITSGGVAVEEIDPSTMKSKKMQGLSFAGEMLALHAFTGGFNLQLAFSTGYLAGQSV